MDIDHELDPTDSLPWPWEISSLTEARNETDPTNSLAQPWELISTKQLPERDAYFLERSGVEPTRNFHDITQLDKMAASLFYVKHMIYLISNNMSDGEGLLNGSWPRDWNRSLVNY